MRGAVEPFSDRPAAKTDQPVESWLVERISWDDLRIFIVVARSLSFRKAATALRTSSSTVARRMERLEATLGLRLFDRLPDGVGLTAEGKSVFATAQQMERASHSLRAHLDPQASTRGVVRCSVTEGLGTAWILPQLLQFGLTHPSTIVDLRCSMEIADVLRMETDVSIQLEKPQHPDVKTVRLGRLHIYPFASKQYAENYGLPESLTDLSHHRIVYQKGTQIEEGALQRMLGIPSIESIVALRTNTSTAHACAIDLGIGIGGLPTYIAALGTRLIPLDIDLRHAVDIWMTYHPDARSVSRVSFFIDWLRTIFDPKRYPWFGDEFIHPRDLSLVDAPKMNETLLNLPILKPNRQAGSG